MSRSPMRVERPPAVHPPFGDGLLPSGEAQLLRLETCARNQYEAPEQSRTRRDHPTTAVLILGTLETPELHRLCQSLGVASDPAIRSVFVFTQAEIELARPTVPTTLETPEKVQVRSSPRGQLARAIRDVALESSADQLLLLHPGVELDAVTLSALGQHVANGDVGAAAPEIQTSSEAGDRPPSLLSCGLKLRTAAGSSRPLPYDLGGASGIPIGGNGVEVVPAANLACLLVKRSDFLATGGLLSDGFGIRAAFDLGQRLSTQLDRRIVVDHRLRATTTRLPGELPTTEFADVPGEEQRAGDHSAFHLRRCVLMDKLRDRRFYSDEPLRLLFVDAHSPERPISAEPDIPIAFHAALGWKVARTGPSLASELVSHADVIVSRFPGLVPDRIVGRRAELLSIAWVDESSRWDQAIEQSLYDFLICSSNAAQSRLRDRWGYDCPVVAPEGHGLVRQIPKILEEFSRDRLRVAIKTPAPGGEAAFVWGDYHFALALQRALIRLGHPTRVDLLPDWYGPHSQVADVVVVLRGVSRYEPRSDQINFVWNISHPEDVERQEYETYDHVFIASTTYARRLKDLKVPVTALLQCTDPRLFFPDPGAAQSSHSVLFVGNSRRQARPIVLDAIEAGLPLAVYGKLWEGIIDSKYVLGEHIPNESLRRYYSNAKIVLNDHWTDMRERGFLSNRLFDAGACGACVVSDPAAGLHELFGDAVQSYETVEDLRTTVEALLADDSVRLAQGEKLRELVLREHTFERRALQIIATAQEQLGRTVKG